MFTLEEVDKLIEIVNTQTSLITQLSATWEQTIRETEILLPVSNDNDEELDAKRKVIFLAKQTVKVKNEELKVMHKLINKLYELQNLIADTKGQFTFEDFIKIQ